MTTQMAENKSCMRILDGSKGEGGGQILRNAIVYASLLKIPIQIHSIRANRNNPGLRSQHVKGLELAVNICGGKLTGAKVGSGTVEYHPAKIQYEFEESCDIISDIGTAGAITLLLQVAVPCWLFHAHAIKSLELIGGTNATFAPQIDYFQDVLLPTISKHCIFKSNSASFLDFNIKTRGYYPIGKGVVSCSLNKFSEQFNGTIRPITLMKRGFVTNIHVKCFHAGKIPEFVPKIIAKSAMRLINLSSLHELSGIQPSIEIIKHEPAVGSACGIMITAKTSTGCLFGGSALQNRNEKYEKVGTRAAQELLDSLSSGGCVDEWLQDQLIIFMALALGTSKIRTGCLTQHTRTAINLATEMTGVHFEVLPQHRKSDVASDDLRSEEYGKDGCIYGQHIITCKGIGLDSDSINTNNMK